MNGSETDPALLPAPDSLETLQQVNAQLRSALIRLQPEQNHCSKVHPQDFSSLRSQIQQAASCLRHLRLGFQATAEIEKESTEYINHLVKLSHLLPDLHIRLLAEKSRLEASKASMAASAAWAGASQETL